MGTECVQLVTVQPELNNHAALLAQYPTEPIGSGTPTDKALDHVVSRVQAAIGDLERTGVTMTALLCTGAFPELQASRLLVLPHQVLLGVLRALRWPGRLGILTPYYDPKIGARIVDLFRPETRLLYLESPGSQTMEVQVLEAFVAQHLDPFTEGQVGGDED